MKSMGRAHHAIIDSTTWQGLALEAAPLQTIDTSAMLNFLPVSAVPVTGLPAPVMLMLMPLPAGWGTPTTWYTVMAACSKKRASSCQAETKQSLCLLYNCADKFLHLFSIVPELPTNSVC